MRSYTSNQPAKLAWFRDVRSMMRSSRGARSGKAIGEWIAYFRTFEEIVREATGRVIEDMKVLDIGAGQLASQLLYFGARNDAIGIDLDVYPRRWRPLDWLTLLRRNGVRRLVKTAGRRLMGVDRAYRAEMAKQLGVRRLSDPRVLWMDAAHMTFADESFDFVYSFDVFEHIADPEQTLLEVKRVLKPKGIVMIVLQHWTSNNGCHDLRVINGARTDLPHWGHLRPKLTQQVEYGAYCNQLSVAAWREMFEKFMPGARIFLRRAEKPELDAALRDARAAGDLSDYTDDELLSPRLTAVWQKA